MNSKTLVIKVQKLRFYGFYTKWQVAELQSQAALFEVPVPDYPLIKQCRVFIDDHDEKKNADKIMTKMMVMKMIISLMKQCKIVS